MNEIKINMTETDFSRLATGGSSELPAGGWTRWPDGFDFETIDSDDKEPSWDWKMQYSFGESWASVLLARSYIEAAGYEYEIIWDMRDEADLSYVILTNFMTARWRQALNLD